MEINMDSITPAEYEITKETIKVRAFHTEVDLNFSRENTESLKSIQKIIFEYENKIQSLDEVLTRVLEFYGEFVPYE